MSIPIYTFGLGPLGELSQDIEIEISDATEVLEIEITDETEELVIEITECD